MAERGEEEAQAHELNENSKRKLDEIQIQVAKQRAQEFLSRIVNNAEPKRQRVDDLSEPPTAPSFPQFSSYPDVTQKSAVQLAPNSQVGSAPFAPQSASYYGIQNPTKKISIPNGKVGVIIGKGGETIKSLQLQSGAKIQITKDSEADLYAEARDVTLTGTAEQVSRAEQLISDVIAESDAGGSGPIGRGSSSMPGVEQFTMKVPNEKVALLIGKGGETIKNMQSRSGARIQIIPLHPPPGDTSTERTVYINGAKDQIELAKEMVNDVISGNRLRNLSTPSSYTQQGYQNPGNWGQPPMQQPGYGYVQPGSYSVPPYYSSYPPQATGWDQSNPGTAPPPAPQYPGYNYYGQQAQTDVGSAQGDVSYAYGQAPPATTQTNDQGYTQQLQTYGQDTPSQVPQQGYSQQTQTYGQDTQSQVPQQGYSQKTQSYGHDTQSQVPQHDQQKPYSAPGYGPPAAQSQTDSTVPNQSYGTQSSTQPPPAYSVSYSQPPTVSPAEYGSSQIYGAPPVTQPSYDQSGYPQPVYGVQQLPQSASQPVYGQGGYSSQPPPAQSSYTQGIAPPYGQLPHPQPPTHTEQ